MKLQACKLLTDENIDSAVVRHLRSVGFDVKDVREAGLSGTSDRELLQICVDERRVIVTHDSDFGTLAFATGEAFVGIVFLRPGHIDPAFTIGSLDALVHEAPDLIEPFVIAVRRNGIDVTIRVRNDC